MLSKYNISFRTIKVVLLSILLTATFIGCKDDHDHAKEDVAKQTYTCPMHPQIVQEKPGTCPICGMDLVLFDKSSSDEALTLGASQQALANISTLKIGSGELGSFTRLIGRLSIDPDKTNYVSSRVAGRIEVLYVKETGIKISKGQPLYKIYSEELSSLQQEYMVTVAQARSFPTDQRFQQMEKAAKQKLLLYGQSESQLAQLIKSQQTSPYVTYSSPSAGVVAELNVTEGQYVAEGSSIMRLENYGQLWVEADVYPSEAGNVRVGQQVKVIVNGFESQPQEMKIEFITPALQSGSQLMQVRGTIPNPGNQWQAGMQVTVLLPGSTKDVALMLPVDAVIRDEKGTHVWIKQQAGKYVPKEVTTGQETYDRVEIKSGLNEGEEVVVTGAYLLYSEYILKKGKQPI